MPSDRLPHRNLSRWIADQPPLVKLTLWVVAVVAVALCVQALAWLTGIEFSILNKRTGSAVLISTALALLLMLIAAERRPMADYGIIADRHWRGRALRGLGIGASVYAGYLLFAWWLGIVQIQPSALSASRGFKALLAGMSAGPIAVTQLIIFSGYLLSTLRRKHSRLTSALLPALLFGAATGAAATGGLSGAAGLRLFVGMTLLAVLLGLLRLRSGSIVFPAGVLAGCILVRKLISKSKTVSYDLEAPAADWLAPLGDPRQGPLLWAVMGLGIAWVTIQLWRRGEQAVEPDAEVDAGFKQIMPFSNLLGMAPITTWLKLLVEARLLIGLKYVPRLAITLIASTAGTLLALPERLFGPLVVRLVTRTRGDAPDPVFIVGMNRSGTTHLHNLLALDPQFRSPRNYEVFNPHGFLTGWLTTAILTPFMTWRRPMDAVQMTVVSSQEEEFALATMGNPSPYWSFCLPREIARHDRYLFPTGFSKRQKQRWERHYRRFLRKLTLFGRRTPLLKNPANTGRVAWLHRLFPQAKFIHIVRHPYAVYRSNLRFANQGQIVFQLQDPHPADNYATRCLDNYRRMSDACEHDLATLRSDAAIRLRFEDLEAHPVAVIEQLYEQFGLELSDKYRQRMTDYLDSIQGYRKNRYPELPDDQREQVDAAMGKYLHAWGYAEQHESKSPTAA